MQLFSYKFEGQIRSGRLVGLLGIDLYRAAQSYLENFEAPAGWSKRPLSSLSDLAQLGAGGLQLVKDSTDWVLQSSQEEDALSQKKGLVFEFDRLTVMAPIPRPGKIICIAGNYPVLENTAGPEYPTIFLKPSSGVIGDQAPIYLPRIAENVVCEVELAVVIGKRGKDIPVNEANSIIAGYTLANDLGDRVLEKRTSQWAMGKMFDTFTPIGPIMVTPTELRQTSNLKMFTRVNGQTVQMGNTSQMFFDVPYLISSISTLTTLEPGDVILTGSPKTIDGNANPSYVLKPGAMVEIGIEKVCTLVNPVKSESQVK